ncbi:MAG TPA: CPBP family intramembrane glutamic endopeptidase [Gemmataceae bacterium]|nr:CPBP family intramembrane glutamic endopeptidase [Gemmataceae bacterium]
MNRDVPNVPAAPPPTGFFAVLHGSALIFAMCFPAVMAWLYFVVLAQPMRETGRPSAAALAAYLAGKVIQFGFPIFWLLRVERRRLRPAVPSFQGLSIGLVFGIAVTALILGTYHGLLKNSPILADLPGRIRDKLILFHAQTPGRYLGLAVFLAGFHSLMEEYYWRWFVFGELRRRLPVALAIALSALAFMAHHVIVLAVYLPQHFFAAALPFALCVAAGGAMWAWLYHRTGTIYSSWISHLVIDAAILTVGYELVFGPATG